MRFNNFCASQDGVEFSKELVNALISLHKGEGEVVLVESIGQELRNSCPSLFSEDDSLRFKGFEALNRSKTAKYREEQLSLLADSVRVRQICLRCCLMWWCRSGLIAHH